MDTRTITRRSLLTAALCGAMLALAAIAHAVSFSEFVDPHPAVNNGFGTDVVPLSTGNVVITSPYDDAGGTDAGAVYLFNGATGALISALRGSTAGDQVGAYGVTALTNGNFVIRSLSWNGDMGAVTWGSGTTGVSGVVSAANSLVGSTAFDQVGGSGVRALANGNYVVATPNWDDGATVDVGAATWGSGTTGVSGVVSAANSLVGSQSADYVGSNGAIALSNGNYVVVSAGWNNGAVATAGAVTWCNGTTGLTGAVSAANSLVGSTTSDRVGASGVAALANGNYVVRSSIWDNGATANVGAVTWGSGTTGITGAVSAANSLIGSQVNDQVGSSGLTVLSNGNYVVSSFGWRNGAVSAAGAATWCDGTTGTSAVVSAANSLVGSAASDQVGNVVTALTNGNYVVLEPRWNNGAIVDAGAATWGSGTSGVSGVVSSGNSLVGSKANDQVGTGVTTLTNGNYVVQSPNWDNGAIVNAGAATWGSGTSGVSGPVSSANSLVGSVASDIVGANVTALSNGNYVVGSPNWDNGATVNAGAATWGSGTSGVSGAVSTANSLVGSTAGDGVGGGVTALSNGNYVVRTGGWDNGAITNAGAATWGSGTTGVTGAVSAANSLVGSTADDQVGSAAVALTNGNYVVGSPNWDNGALTDVGAATWGDGTTGVSGTVSAANSLVGSTAGDQGGFAEPLSNGNYVVITSNWNNGALASAGAATWGSGSSGVSGLVSITNSVVGEAANTGLYSIVPDGVNNTFLALFSSEDGGRVRVGASNFGPTGVHTDGPVDFALEGVRPNPAIQNRLNVVFALPSGAPARLDLMDVSGRRVVSREVGSMGTGRHTVNLSEGRKLVSGLYWVRLTQGAKRRARSVAVIE